MQEQESYGRYAVVWHDARGADGAPSCGDEGEIGQPLIHRLARALWACKHAYTAELGINAAVAWMLSLLAEQDGRTQHELTTTMRTDPSMVTRLIQEMEREHGWIRRERDEQDNRLVRVYLTEAGRDRAHDLAGRVGALEARLTRNLSGEGVRTLHTLLQTLEETARAEEAAASLHEQQPIAQRRDATPRKGES
jgi:MarR family transcriptional regulator, organic hydroperoxide resistance regulator